MSEPFTYYATETQEGLVVTYTPPKRNRTREILSALQAGQQLSGKDIWQRFGIYRASSVIHKLKKQGHDITCEMVNLPDGRRYGVYFIDK